MESVSSTAGSAGGGRRRQARSSTSSTTTVTAVLVALQLLATAACCGARANGSAASKKKTPVVPAVIVFGDSTVDTGNNNAIGTVLKSNFPPYGRDLGGQPTGRFCNGRMATDFVSEALGLPPLVPAYLDPAYGIDDFARGVCFASAGTGLDNATASVMGVIPLWKEVEYFKEYQQRLRKHVGHGRARRIIGDAVYIMSIGTNDFLENYFLLVTGRFAEFTVGEYSDFLVARAEEFLAAIYRLGARRIAFTGLSAIGCVPLERTLNLLRGGGCVEEYNQVAVDYNVKLKAMFAGLSRSLPGIRLGFVPVYDAMLDIINNPSTLGLENVNEGCCATGKVEMGYLCNDKCPLTCQDADKYFFWDSFHPTEKLNQFFSKTTTRETVKALKGDAVTALGVVPSETQLMMEKRRRRQKHKTSNPVAIVRFAPATTEVEC